MKPKSSSFIPQSTWRAREQTHREELAPITTSYRQRKARGTLHPVHDFLFSYYSYTAGKLEQWHPSLSETLQVDPSSQPSEPRHFRQKHYHRQENQLTLNPSHLQPKEIERFRFARRLLEKTAHRPANFGCYGLHEWAMVYQSDNPRHRERAPLRLSMEKITDFVNGQTLACSHFDAVRFFTPAAQPRNRLQPTLLTREDHEQPGCIHANMDLYKWTFKAMPWLGSDLLRATFFLALELRELDMRASPYDLSSYGYEPIAIETPAGRAEYVHHQQHLAHKAETLRFQILHSFDSLIEQVTIPSPIPST